MPERRFLAQLPHEAALLLRAVHELSFARDVSSITAIAGSAARQLTGADGVSFVVREAGISYYAHEDSIEPLWKGRRFPLDSCIAGWVMTHGTPAVVPDVYQDDRVPADEYRQTFVKSLAMVPVRAADPIAAIGAYWARPHTASDEEVGAMILLAESAALALANVQLYEELRAAASREQQARILAETATSAKDEFLALVAHELRQPLHACIAALRLMEARVDRQSGERARHVVERQLQQMTRLVEDLLDAARIVRGDVELRRGPLELAPLIKAVVESIKPLMDERKHELQISVPTDRIALSADGARLQQILMNLLTNAAKYTDPAGRVGLAVERCDGEVIIRVRDSGCGIDHALLPRIFDLFTRGAPDRAGFGVGLAVSKRLVELHGGSIRAHSAGAGHGSEFIVSLPTEN